MKSRQSSKITYRVTGNGHKRKREEWEQEREELKEHKKHNSMQWRRWLEMARGTKRRLQQFVAMGKGKERKLGGHYT